MIMQAIKTPKIVLHKPELKRYFEIASDTQAGVTYIIRRIADRWICSCPDFRKHAADHAYECKHVRAVLLEIAEMQNARLQAEMTRIAQDADVRGLIAAMQTQLDELRAQVASLASAPQPLHISAAQIVIDGPVRIARQAKDESQEAKATAPEKIEEITTNGKLVACVIDGYKVTIFNGMTIACSCEKGSDGKQCKHDEEINKYLLKREEQPVMVAQVEQPALVAQPAKEYDPMAAPLNGNRGFSLLRK